MTLPKNEKSTNTVEPLEQSNYTLLTFGSLLFMVIALYLPQLLPQLSKLKVAGVELEKSTVDPIKCSRDFGLERQASALGKGGQIKSVPDSPQKAISYKGSSNIENTQKSEPVKEDRKNTPSSTEESGAKLINQTDS